MEAVNTYPIVSSYTDLNQNLIPVFGLEASQDLPGFTAPHKSNGGYFHLGGNPCLNSSIIQ
jgi:hypothetical protein